VAYYWDNPVKHDRPLITNCFVPGLACAAGMKPSSATEELDLDILLTNVALADQEGRPLSYSRHRAHKYRGIPCIPVHDSIVVPLQYEGEAREALYYGWCSQNVSPSLCNIEKKRQKAPQDGGEGLVPDHSSLPDPGSGWWSSVLAEARYDVVEWCAPSIDLGGTSTSTGVVVDYSLSNGGDYVG
jgi:hypothetical protein